jgi:hypothetical protein
VSQDLSRSNRARPATTVTGLIPNSLRQIPSGRVSASLRIGFLLTLLVGEVALFASFRSLGWYSTNGKILWASCLLCAILPLVAAVVVLGRHRLRFNLRTMLIAMALVATFLYLSVRPLQTAMSSRQGSRSLLATGATLHTKSSWDSVYQQLKYDPRPAAIVPVDRQLAFWLRPLAGSLLKIPMDNEVREIWLGSDHQVDELCHNAANFSNLERISVETGVTPAGMENLLQSLLPFAHLTDFQIGVAIPRNSLRSLSNVRTLTLWGEKRIAGATLSDEQLRDIAALPNLRVLYIFMYKITDADVQVLAESKTLKRIILKKTGMTQSSQDKLSAAMPDCVINRDP